MLCLSYCTGIFGKSDVGKQKILHFSLIIRIKINMEFCIIRLFSAIHEGGHAIFEQNVNPEYDNTAAGSCRYMGVHESQSRFYENILGRNKNFWIPVYEKVQELMPQMKDISLDEFYREINHVRNSLIRTEADEVTYCFHIILRYEMEKAIFREMYRLRNFRNSGIRK